MLRIMPRAALALIATLAVAGPASATEMVTNGGFETGNFTGWTQFGAVGQTNVNAADALTASFGARFSPNTIGGIFQDITTVTGQAYRLTFDLRHLANLLAPNNSFSVSFDGVVLGSLLNVGTTGPTTFDYSPIASGVVSQLRFSFKDTRDAPANRFSLDNVSLTSIASLPEPQSWFMLTIGFGLTGFAVRRSRSRFPSVAA